MLTFSYSIISFPFIIPLLLLPFTNAVSFEITRFDPSDTRVVYEGGAAPISGAIEFNDVNYMCQTGRAIFAEKIPIWDSKTNQLTDFNTDFSFYIDIQHRNQYGSGLAFFLAPVGSHLPINSAGGFLGLYNFTNSDSADNQMVHIEFDSYFNREWDPNFLHVGINNNSIHSSVFTRWNASFHSGDPANVSIAYNSKSKNLTVSWKYKKTSIPSENTSLFLIIDLMKILPEWVIIGFSASTSNRIERHVVQSWKFDSNLEIHGEKEINPSKLRLVEGLAVSGAILLTATAAFVIFSIRKWKIENSKEKMSLKSINIELENETGPRRFSYKDLVKATSNFSNEKKLGQGGFGAVYKGYLSHLGRAVAVKKISSLEDGRNEFMSEVKMISQLKHRNLVQLIGWCHDKGKFLLVYEIMPNGSLDAHLFDKKFPLTWTARYKIALDLASALLYLHEEIDGGKCVLHRDIKPSNIMLDSSFNVRLGDFGLAKYMEQELGLQTTKVAGTRGYIAPEYISTGRASKESDVYSFGIVALEIVTGRKMSRLVEHNNEMMTLVDWIRDLYRTGNLRMGVDEILEMDFDDRQMERLMVVGLCCAHSDKKIRPPIKQVIRMLNFEVDLPNPETGNSAMAVNVPEGENSAGESSSSEPKSQNLMSYSSFGGR